MIISQFYKARLMMTNAQQSNGIASTLSFKVRFIGDVNSDPFIEVLGSKVISLEL